MVAGVAIVLGGCGGISDCKEDGAKCAEMLNANADKCAVSYQFKQSDPKRKSCENAVKVVAQQKVKEALPALITILGVPESTSAEDKHRVEAAKAMSKIGDVGAVDALIKAIDYSAGTSGDPRDKNANLTNEEIATALGALKDKRAVQPLIELADKSKAEYPRVKAVRALGEIGDPAAVDILTKLALEHDEAYMRKNAVLALGDIGDAKATDALIQMMFVEHRGVSFYREASFAIFKLGPVASDALIVTLEGKNEAVNKYFEKTGGVKDTAVKAKTSEVLGDLREKKALALITAAFDAAAKSQDAIVGFKTATALGALGDPASVAVLKPYMGHVDPSWREPIMKALNQIGDRAVAAEMIASTTKQSFIDSCVKQKYGTKEECSLEDNKPSWQGAQKTSADAATLLAGADQLDAYKKVVDAEEDAGVKDYLAKRLPRLEAAAECKADAACWAGKLKSPDGLVRERAAWELGRLKDPSTNAALADALGDKRSESRQAAIFAYWVYGDASAIPAIEKRLSDEASSADFIRVNEDLKRLLVHLKRKK